MMFARFTHIAASVRVPFLVKAEEHPLCGWTTAGPPSAGDTGLQRALRTLFAPRTGHCCRSIAVGRGCPRGVPAPSPAPPGPGKHVCRRKEKHFRPSACSLPQHRCGVTSRGTARAHPVFPPLPQALLVPRACPRGDGKAPRQSPRALCAPSAFPAPPDEVGMWGPVGWKGSPASGGTAEASPSPRQLSGTSLSTPLTPAGPSWGHAGPPSPIPALLAHVHGTTSACPFVLAVGSRKFPGNL